MNRQNIDPIDAFLSLQNTEVNDTKTVENAWFKPSTGRRLLGTGALLSSLLAAAATPNNAVMARSPRHSVDPVPVSAPYQPGAVDPFAFMGVPDGTLGQKGGMVKPKKAKSRRAPMSPEQRLANLKKENAALWDVNDRLVEELRIWGTDARSFGVRRTPGIGDLLPNQRSNGTVEDKIKVYYDENIRLQKNNNLMRDELYRIKKTIQRTEYDTKYSPLDKVNIAPHGPKQSAGRYGARARNL